MRAMARLVGEAGWRLIERIGIGDQRAVRISVCFERPKTPDEVGAADHLAVRKAAVCQRARIVRGEVCRVTRAAEIGVQIVNAAVEHRNAYARAANTKTVHRLGADVRHCFGQRDLIVTHWRHARDRNVPTDCSESGSIRFDEDRVGDNAHRGNDMRCRRSGKHAGNECLLLGADLANGSAGCDGRRLQPRDIRLYRVLRALLHMIGEKRRYGVDLDWRLEGYVIECDCLGWSRIAVGRIRETRGHQCRGSEP